MGGSDLLVMHTCNYTCMYVAEALGGAACLDCIFLAVKMDQVKYTSATLRAPKCRKWEK